jgi:hypothetical protein
MKRWPDVENVLFYNVRPTKFKNAATKMLRFEKRTGPMPNPPIPLRFEAHHHVLYQGHVKRQGFHNTEGHVLASSSVLRPPHSRGEHQARVKPASFWGADIP